MLIVTKVDALHIVIDAYQLAYLGIRIIFAPKLIFVDKIIANSLGRCVGADFLLG